MKRNTASQVIGAQLVNATTGAAFTGSVTVYVTGDGGTQAAGSVGSGACTHEGNGFHTYAPAQAETDYAHVAFTFVGTGAVPATVQVYPSFPQTGDAFSRLGAPAGASVSADVAAIKAETAAILVDTGTTLQAKLDGIQADTEDIQSRLPAALVSGRIDASVGAMAANVMTAAAAAADLTTELQAGLATSSELSTVAGYLDTEIAAILADTNELQTDWANGGRLDLILDARASQASVDELPTNAELASALGDIPTATENADALLNRDMSAVSDTTARSPLNALRFLRNKWSISGTTLTVTKEDDAAAAWTATVSTTAGADPVTGNDPA